MPTPAHEVQLPIPAGVRLSGTLRLPPGAPVAAALLLPGSGPVDRDSDHRKLPLGVTRLLADALAAQGVASLRYDKRGVGASEGEFLEAGLTDTMADARVALSVLRERPELAGLPLVVVGHSEGALVATAVAAEEPIEAVVLLAGAARDGRATLAWQAQALQPDIPAPVRALLRLLRTDLVAQNRKRVDKIARTTADSGRSGGVKLNLRWHREFIAYDPALDLPRITAPVLAITGAKDQQVPPEDVAAMEGLVTAPFTGHVVADVNHILRETPGPASMKTYRKQAAEPLAGAVLDRITAWLPQVLEGTGIQPADR